MLRVTFGSPRERAWAAAWAIAFLAVAPTALAQQAPAPTTTLDRIREAGRIRLGYYAAGRPFSYRNESGQAAGYTVALCQRVAEAVQRDVGRPDLAVEWVQVSIEERFRAIGQGEIDLLCGATATISGREQVSFSIPVFPGGVGALLRTDAAAPLTDILEGREARTGPLWRGSPAVFLEEKTFAVIGGTVAERWLGDRLQEFKIASEVVAVESFEAGLQHVLDRTADVFFGDRAILLDAATRHASANKLMVLDRLFSYEPVALALARGDEDFRLVVDRTLSRLYAAPEFTSLYAQWFGQPSDVARTFFRWNALPD